MERLRWVLRQQREHFLPLKVIRDRLADGDLDDAGGADVPNGKPAEPRLRRGRRGAGARPTAQEQPTKADEEAMARILADASRRAARLARGGRRPAAGLQVVAEGDAVDDARRPSPVGERGRDVGAGGGGAPTPRRAARDARRPRRSLPRRRARATATTENGQRQRDAASRRGRNRPRRHARAVRRPTRRTARKSPAHASTGDGGGRRRAGRRRLPAWSTGASLTAEELCAASGLSVEEVAGLEGFGLIECVTVAGIDTYDEDALTVANLAAAFRAFGIEPRHLRLYRNAVDREMGLIEQVVIPLLRQRNPESRQRAVEGAEQLAALGQSMRATLLRLALRRHLGG